MYRPKFKVKSNTADRKTGLGRGLSKNLSPSQKIIRDYKRSEVNKYSASPHCTDTPRTSTAEWQILYTTQLTQKAKKFHDGILRLSVCGSQSRQVFLYDESGRLLDSRFLKSDENIRSGESLKLDGHLVEIGDLKGDNEPLQESKLDGDCIVVEKTVLEHQQIQTETNCPEWQVLYTTQLTQKTKKFHDGLLKLSVCGSQRRQVFLYDESRRLLDSRFLKTDEYIKSGESLKLDGYLVEIGDKEPLEDSKRLEGDHIVVGETEWDAMYTSQVTQQSKKYHSGILQIASCGSYRMQATLLAEDKTVLSRKYLKLSEHLSSGSKFKFSNYLVEVGEPRKHYDGFCYVANFSNKSFGYKDKASLVNNNSIDNVKIKLQSKDLLLKEPDSVKRNYRVEKITQSKVPCIEGLQSKDSPWKETDSVLRSSTDEINSCRETSTKEPFRNAHAILSLFKRPATQEVCMKKEIPEKDHALQTSDLGISEIQNSVQNHLVEDSCGQCNLLEDSNGETVDIIPSDTSGNPESKILASASSLCEGNKRRATSSKLAPQIINCDSDVQPPIVSVLNKNQESTSCQASGISFSQSYKSMEPGKLSQELYADNLETGSRCNEACNVNRKNLSTTVTDEFPSFDLGF